MDSMERLNYFAVLLNAKLYTLPEIKKMSDKELKKWLETNWSDEAGISKVFGTQLKTASKEASKRKIKWKKK